MSQVKVTCLTEFFKRASHCITDKTFAAEALTVGVNSVAAGFCHTANSWVDFHSMFSMITKSVVDEFWWNVMGGWVSCSSSITWYH